MAFAADSIRGRELYTIHCAGCHGATGAPVMPGSPDLKRGQALLRPDGQLLNMIRSGRGAMPGYLGILKERDILDIIAHLRTLS